jgi:hypothetical protein
MSLLSILKSIDSADGKFGYITVHTAPNMRKTHNPYVDRVTKVSTIQFRLQNYRSVKASFNGVTADEVSVQPLSWAKHISKFVIKHKTTGQLYFQLKPERSHATYFVDKKVATPAQIKDIKGYIPKKDGPPWISVKLDNIVRLSINKVKYSV